MRSTRTHTQYWSEESVEALKAEIAKLYDDFQGRKPYIDSEAAEAMQRRLSILAAAAELLTDNAD